MGVIVLELGTAQALLQQSSVVTCRLALFCQFCFGIPLEYLQWAMGDCWAGWTFGLTHYAPLLGFHFCWIK